MQNKILEINKLLLSFFCKPYRAEKFPEPIDMLIGTILSQNTNDKNSYRAYKNLKIKFTNWEKVQKARRSTIEKEIKVAGLALQKSTTIKTVLNELFKRNGNLNMDFIKDMEENDALEYLISFKGVGVKTASCVLLFSLNKDICPVDTHLHRTLNRIGLVNTKTPDKTFFAINKNFPPKIAHSFHTNLIRLGREICKPKGYSCGVCPTEKICNFNEKNIERVSRNSERAFMLLDHI